MASIKPIESQSVHQIQSGQVIVDLTSVVKELVENSLDAGATSIDVRFRAQGLELIEIQDNGAGISPVDFDSIALKHYTSKLKTYGDLAALTTYGFRGEALSSLCAVSRLHITTARESEAPKGTRLDFDSSGALSGTSTAACQKGTIITVQDLFYRLPVRRRELEKNIKREYGKVLGLLHAYACISTRVKISVSNQAAKGKRIPVFSTSANSTARENLANVYGAKASSMLMPLNLSLHVQPTIDGSSTRDKDSAASADTQQVCVVGYVSRPVFGEGRQTPDRQMFFVNSRPCGLPQIAKVFNETYRSFNYTQSPFVFANLIMDTSSYDVNVSPDKRTILLHGQAQLLDSLKEQLQSLFGSQDQTVPVSQVSLQKPAIWEAHKDVPSSSVFDTRSSPQGHTVDAMGVQQSPTTQEESFPRPETDRRALDRSRLPVGESQGEHSPSRRTEIQDVTGLSARLSRRRNSSHGSIDRSSDIEHSAPRSSTPTSPTSPTSPSYHQQRTVVTESISSPSPKTGVLSELETRVFSRRKNPSDKNEHGAPQHADEQDSDQDRKHRAAEEARIEGIVRDTEAKAQRPSQQLETRIAKSMLGSTSNLKQVESVNTSVAALEFVSYWPGRETVSLCDPQEGPNIASRVTEEERLSLIIAKSDFADMRIIGQFNLGFILVVRCGPGVKDNLFIIDQHASDEIYNFSILSRTTVLTPQPLVRPHVLKLTAIEEETIIAHKDSILLKNGFNVSVDLSGQSSVGERCRLLTIPTSQETVFGLGDLEELLALLDTIPTPRNESMTNNKSQQFVYEPGVPRPSRVRRMLAMRACRSSIMVGHTLTQSRMENVVKHMGEIERPWNCPHGRPTMRHIAGLAEWHSWDERDGLCNAGDIVAGGQTDWLGWLRSSKD